MSKTGHDYTDEQLAALESKIAGTYKEAADDVSKTVDDYFKQFEKRDAEQLKLVESGQLSKDEYTQWRLTQMGRGERYKDLQNQLAERYTNANEVTTAYVNDATPGIYSLNRNYSAYTIEQAGENADFNLWDESTVRRNLLENPNLMPNYPVEKALRRGIDLAYGKERITANVTSGILQGLSPYEIADNLQTYLEDMNRESAIRTARTAFTAAENAGTQDAFEEASDMGIEMEKEWIATLDDRTRDDHLDADGQVVPYDEPFIVGGEELMYPGDPSGEPEQVYNCRCTMIARVAGTDMSDMDRRGSGENFEDWLEEKGADEEMLDELEDPELAIDNQVPEYENLDPLVDVVKLADENDEAAFFDDDPCTQEWLGSLTKDEEDAINGYTAGQVDGINPYLRGQMTEAELAAFNQESKTTVQQDVDNITNAIAKSYNDENIQVYRYCQSDVLEHMDLQPGNIVREEAFCSTAVIPEGVRNTGEVEMVIDVPAGDGFGAYIQPLADADSDCHEFLLQRGTDFMVNAVEQDETGKTIVHMTVLGNSQR